MTSRSALVLALAACSGGRHHGVDAPPIDVAVDTLQPTSGDPPANAVALYVTVLGAGAPNVPVYFQTTDGTVELAAVTDSRGLVWTIASPGDFVTAIEPAGPTPGIRLSTFAAVQPGDRLHLDLQPTSGAAQLSLTLQVPMVNNATGYAVHNPCGDVVTLDATAVGPATFGDCGGGVIDLVVTPLDSQGLTTLGALYAPSVAIASGTAVALNGTYTPFDPTTVSYTNVPGSVSFLGAYRAIVTPRGRVFDVSSGAQPSAGSASTMVLEPHTTNTTALTVTVETPQPTELGQQIVIDWRPPGAYALDVVATRLPEFDLPATFAVDSARISWTERGGGLAPSFVRALVDIARPGVLEGRAWHWRVAGPRTGTSIALPHIPNDGFDYNAAQGDTVTVEDVTTAIVPGGYDVVRGRAFDDLVHAVTGPTGTIIVEDTYSPPL